MPRHYVLNAEPGRYAVTVSPVTFVLSTQLAQDWLNDGRREANHPRSPDNWHYRRREVLFAVCFLEAYLFEWTLSLLRGNGNLALKYFPADDKRGVSDKWGWIPAELHRDGLLPNEVRVSKKHSASWLRLLTIRNGITHGTSSWPEVRGSTVARPGPKPKLSDVSALPPGWAINVAVYRVKALHAAAGTPVPAWVTTSLRFTPCPASETPIAGV